MPAKPKPSDADVYAALAARLAALDDQAETIRQARQAIVVELLRMHPDNGRHPAGPIAVQVARSQRIDAKAIEHKYPPEQRPELYDTDPKVSVAKVRANIAPVDLEPFLTESAPTVKVVDSDD